MYIQCVYIYINVYYKIYIYINVYIRSYKTVFFKQY